jgi:hypothetical protein
MQILSHRGQWSRQIEKNSSEAFVRSFTNRFGTETDVRDHHGALVISHDFPVGQPMELEHFLEIYTKIGLELPLALNIKSDGLQKLLTSILEKFKVMQHCFVFDMSVPDMLGWLKTSIPVFTRHSDIEPEPVLYDQVQGVWLDGFYSTWWNADTIRRHLDRGKRVCVVSPELHGRDHAQAWDILATCADCGPELMICTDAPEEISRKRTQQP